jgi:hypothetical protein
MKINKITIAPMRVAAFILLVLAWSKGEVSGLLAWILLLLVLDITFEYKPK